MTLAIIFLLGIFLTPSANSMPGAGLRPSSDTVLFQSTQDAQGQSAPSQTQGENKQNGTGAPAKPQAGKQTTATPHRRKKKSTTGCGTMPAASSTAANAGSAKKSSAGSTDGQTSTGTKPAQNCPPQKIVVRHGGTTDPSIQLAGGASGGQATQERATANQMLASTEENLKKLEARQLSASEQATITQIREYVTQSKSAITSNDLERARTLAWKAQTLSDDLINPKQ
ncbi:MAG: hypothetical protein WAM79_04550 [Candidatus Sulfotelmatobacter sp.]